MSRTAPQQVVLKIDVIQLRNITNNNDVGIEIEHLVVIRQELLNEETVVRFDTDMRIVCGQIVARQLTFHIQEPQTHVRKLLEEAPHTLLLVPCDILLQNNYIVETV